MRLDILYWQECMDILEWRNKHLETLRTSQMLTEDMQQKFYDEVISNRDSKHRYWAIRAQRKEIQEPPNNLTCNDELFIGVGGLTNISWENRNAEISLILCDTYQGMGLGEQAVDLLLDQGFNYMNLENIYGEVYECNRKGVEFWLKIIQNYKGWNTIWPDRKFWEGQYWDSIIFQINKEDSP